MKSSMTLIIRKRDDHRACKIPYGLLKNNKLLHMKIFIIVLWSSILGVSCCTNNGISQNANNIELNYIFDYTELDFAVSQ